MTHLLSLQDISKIYDHRIILDHISLSVSKNERIALVGKNGSGKTSLLKIIAGNLEFDEGQRTAINHLKITSLEQKPYFPPKACVNDVLQESMGELKKANERLKILTQLIENNPSKEILDEYAQISTFLDEHNGWDLESKTLEILQRFELLPFKDRLANSLSGGEQKRVALAGLLLQSTDILLLDEPTNHLDAQMVMFLEQFLLDSKTTLVFISHDRYFIDHIATRIIEIDEGKIRCFEGGYLAYLNQKELILKNLNTQHQKLLKLLKTEEEWLRKGVKARLKRNEGRKNRLIAMRQEAKKNPSVLRKMQLELQREQQAFNRTEGKNNKKCLFEIQNLSKYVGDKCLIKNLNLRILQNEKIAIVGKNGSGKTSFLKILLGEQQPSQGVIKVGDIRIGYFDQHITILEDDKDLLETFCPMGGDHIQVKDKNMHVYGYLKNFLFPKEFLNQKIGALSGGEKNRVALALLFTKEVDVLLLDEPTNDLDIQTINIIEEYLLSMSCSVIFVSHDRYFVDKLAQKLLIFEGNGKVSTSHLAYSQYLDIQESLDEIQKITEKINKNNSNENPKDTLHEHKNNKQATKLSYNEQRALQSLPSQIATLESHIKMLQDSLSNPKIYETQGINTLAKELADAENELEEKINHYLLLDQKSQGLL